MYYKY